MDNEYLIKKWLSDELSDTEKVSFDAMEDAKLYEEIVQEAQRFKGDHQAKVVSFEELDKRLTSEKSKSNNNWMKVVSRIAAIFIVGFSALYFFNRDEIQNYETALAQTETITLPDNSIVNLNEQSQLDYNKSTWDDKRSLNLEGEAFFDVEKGMRFDVVTEHGTVSVLGTEFNVIAKDGQFKVSCYEGLVSVTFKDEEVLLPAGKEFEIKSGNSTKTKIAISEPNWLKNLSVFDNAELNDVIAELEKQYNVNIDYLTDNDTVIKFSGAFEHNNLENALKSITQPLNLTFSVNNEEVKIRNANN